MEARSNRKTLIIVVLGFIVCILVVRCWWCWWSPVPVCGEEVTTVYITRHAEKLNNSDDTPLSPLGLIRAEELAHVLKDAGIEGVFASQYQRTQQTGAPTAIGAGVNIVQYNAHDTQSAVQGILAAHSGKTILIVGHSNTVDDIASGLGVAGVSVLDETQFDRLFVVHINESVTYLERLRYGVETP